MPGALATLLPLITAGVLIASALAKIRHPDDLAGWVELGVPGALRRPLLLKLHPWGELALGVVLIVFGGVLGLIAATIALALMAAYLWLVWGALHRTDDASCACFGARRRITRLTVARNAWLTLLAAGTAAVIWINPALGGALAGVAEAWTWVAGAAIAAVTTGLIVWPDAAERIPADGPSTVAGGDDEIDYIRTRTPAVPITLADGTIVNLRTLSATQPILLLAVSPTCASCVPVIDRVGEWRALLPELDIRLLLRHEPGGGLTERSEPQSLHDPKDYVSSSIGDWPTPTAVLLGADGLLAGGPVTGSDQIAEFIDDVYENLHGERPASVDSAT